VDNLTVAEVVNELEISRSYLYKVIKDENIIIDKSATGRYIWNNEVVHQLKLVLDIPTEEENIGKLIEKYGLRQSYINNRRYLGNKYSLSSFIRQTVEDNCSVVNTVVDIFSGTGAVADVFKDKMIITNDLLYSNYISNYAWFYPEEYSEKKIIEYIAKYNSIHSSENNYMRENFADTFFSADDCSKIGIIREDIEVQYKEKDINFKEYTILITSLLYGIDRIANTVGHYDAYRKNAEFEKPLDIPVILPSKKLNENNNCYNLDANKLIENTQCDLLYLDPPYNSRQYCDAYHLLENVARWEKPKVYGVAKKMDRISLKSEYCTISATEAFKKLIEKANARYILLSYNNMSSKGNDRSNAKINDEDILKILEEKGNVKVFKQKYKSFTTGKSDINDNAERLFLCETFAGIQQKQDIISPLNYIGGKFELLTQLKPLFPETSCFLDLFSGGGNVGINSEATKIIFNDKNKNVIDLLEFFKNTETKSLLKKIDEIIKEYGLSNTSLFGYEYYGCNSSKGLSDYNKDKFLKLRNDFNNTEKNGSKDLALLYVLIVFSFNNQIRFNRKGEFNLPVGKRDFNSKMRSKLILFSEALKRNDISFLNKDFREIDLKLLPSDTFIYCDPPYLITTATYNENGSWTNKDEIDLLNFLNKVNKLDFKFALSNVLSAKNKINVLLKEWIEINGYNCHSLLKSYSNSNYQRKNKNTISEEVLITNY
jgi:adenine-specific DNA-methyltransferase